MIARKWRLGEDADDKTKVGIGAREEMGWIVWTFISQAGCRHFGVLDW